MTIILFNFIINFNLLIVQDHSLKQIQYIVLPVWL